MHDGLGKLIGRLREHVMLNFGMETLEEFLQVLGVDSSGRVEVESGPSRPRLLDHSHRTDQRVRRGET